MLLDTPPVGAVPVMVSAEVEEAEACIHHSRPWTDKVGVGVPVDEADTENARPPSTPTLPCALILGSVPTTTVSGLVSGEPTPLVARIVTG